MSNSVAPDETAHYEPSHLDLCCLQKPMAVKELNDKSAFICRGVVYKRIVSLQN